MKKINQRGFSHIELLIAVVVVIIVAAIGFYVYNNRQDRSSQAESAIAVEPTRVDNDTTTLTKLTEVQKVESARSFMNVINDSNIGQVFACKVNANFYDGVKYYFTGANAKKMWTTWNVAHPQGGSGASGNSPRLEQVDTVKRFKASGRGPSDFITSWRFSLKNANNNRVDSAWIVHKDLTRCP